MKFGLFKTFRYTPTISSSVTFSNFENSYIQIHQLKFAWRSYKIGYIYCYIQIYRDRKEKKIGSFLHQNYVSYAIKKKMQE